MTETNFSELSDESVVVLAKDGDTAALDYILEKYKPLVKAKSRAYFLKGADNEDIIQEGMIGLYKSVRDFNAEKYSSYKAFAELCVNRQVITAVKAATRQKHTPLNDYVSLNKPVFDEDSQETIIDNIKAMESDNPETMMIGREAREGIEEHLIKNLSRYESTVLNLLLPEHAAERALVRKILWLDRHQQRGIRISTVTRSAAHAIGNHSAGL